MKLIKVLAIASGIAAVTLNSGVAFAKRDKRDCRKFKHTSRSIPQPFPAAYSGPNLYPREFCPLKPTKISTTPPPSPVFLPHPAF
jgi:hypothetical protein